MCQVICNLIDERFSAYWFDIRSPIEIQKDMAHLHSMRKLVESVGNKVVMVVLAGILAILAGIKFILPLKDNG